MLDYENQLFLEILNEDALVVAAEGLALERVLVNLLKVYCDAGNLVLVLGAGGDDEERLVRDLDALQVRPLPRFLTGECGVNDRTSLYLEGGVIFGSARILVVDLLTGRLPAELVTGVLVLRGHRITETSQEAFILRLLRQKNRTAFIKAFSGAPVSFTRGFARVDRVMRSLFVRHLMLWPRFQATVQATLARHEAQVVELRLPLTPMMVAIQTALLDLIRFTINELRRINPSLDLEEMSVENALSKSYAKIVKFQLEPVWHQLSGKTKQLVSDVGTLRTLLVSLTHYDCVTFHCVVRSLRTTEQALRTAGWMLLDAAETLFVTARARVFGPPRTAPDAAAPGETKEGPVGPAEEVAEEELLLEENPKWKALVQVLDEIRDELAAEEEVSPESSPESTKTLVVTQDDRTCLQLRSVLESGARALLLSLHRKATARQAQPRPGLPRRAAAGAAAEPPPTAQEAEVELVEGAVVVQPLKGAAEALTRLAPRYVVAYDCDLALVRRLEAHQARQQEVGLERRMRVYFFVYDASAEEQAFLTALRREKQAFQMLIREKASMVAPEDRDGRDGQRDDLVRDPRKASDLATARDARDTRDGHAQDQDKKSVVVVDMREFRSELPSLLHRRGIDIAPVTIDVGDYILTPDIAVERKSLSDLIGSLNSGRLYNQVQSMSRHYAKPMLLIEFEHDKPFALQGKFYLSTNTTGSGGGAAALEAQGLTDVTSRLQLLTLHFPKLRIVWSPGPYATAEIFAELKKGRAEPDAAQAQSLTSDSYAVDGDAKYNAAVQDLVSKLPGVTTKNLRRLLNGVDDLAHLLSMSQDDLTELLENSINAVALWAALHSPHRSNDADADAKDRRAVKRRKGKAWRK